MNIDSRDVKWLTFGFIVLFLVGATLTWATTITESGGYDTPWWNASVGINAPELYRGDENFTQFMVDYVDSTPTGNVSVSLNSGASIGSQSQLNFIEGTNVSLSIDNDPINGEIDITITSTGGGIAGGAFATITMGGSGDYVANGNNDQKTFQNAVNAVGAAGGGIIWVGEGNFVFEKGSSPQVLINYTKIQIWGNGRSTIIDCNNGGGNQFQISATGDGFEAHNFFIQGDPTATNQHAFKSTVNGGNDLVYQNIYVEDLGSHTVNTSLGHAFSVEAGGRNIRIQDCQVLNSGYGTRIEDAEDITITGNRFMYNVFGVSILAQNNDISNIVVADNICSNNTKFKQGDGIHIGKPNSTYDIYNVTVSGNICNANGWGSDGGVTSWAGHGIIIHSKVYYVSITGNVACYNNAVGIEVIQQSANTVISGNTCNWNGERAQEANKYTAGIMVRASDSNHPTRRVVISGNQACYNYGAGLEIFAQSADQVWDIHVSDLFAIGNAHGAGDSVTTDVLLQEVTLHNSTFTNIIGTIDDNAGGVIFTNCPDMNPENLGDHSVLGTVVLGQAGGSIAIGEVVYMASDGDYEIIDADAAATMPAVAISLEGLSSPNTGRFLIEGYMRDDTWNTFTVGDVLWAGESPGLLQQTEPTGSAGVIQAVGYSVDASPDIIYFDPMWYTELIP